MLEAQIDEFLDAISQGALVFKDAIKHYLSHEKEKFRQKIVAINGLENKADDLRRAIESHLYTHSLIPEHRGDVLGLLESMDDVIDTAKNSINQFSIESPDVMMELMKEFVDLADKSAMAAESMVLASRNFFREVKAVKDHLHKVYFYEKEADKIADRLKRMIFDLNIDLSRKMQLSNFVQHVDQLADRAEQVADRLSIYAIKRSV
ncbi:MAG: DUF47 domain-containing protein [bacterium]